LKPHRKNSPSYKKDYGYRHKKWGDTYAPPHPQQPTVLTAKAVN